MRLKLNLLSKREWEDKKKLIELNIDDLGDWEKDFKDKLGLNQYFTRKNLPLLELSAINNAKHVA